MEFQSAEVPQYNIAKPLEIPVTKGFGNKGPVVDEETQGRSTMSRDLNADPYICFEDNLTSNDLIRKLNER